MKRYRTGGYGSLVESDDGPWVRYDDAVAALSDLRRQLEPPPVGWLRSQLDKAEAERATLPEWAGGPPVGETVNTCKTCGQPCPLDYCVKHWPSPPVGETTLESRLERDRADVVELARAFRAACRHAEAKLAALEAAALEAQARQQDEARANHSEGLSDFKAADILTEFAREATGLREVERQAFERGAAAIYAALHAPAESPREAQAQREGEREAGHPTAAQPHADQQRGRGELMACHHERAMDGDTTKCWKCGFGPMPPSPAAPAQEPNHCGFCQSAPCQCPHNDSDIPRELADEMFRAASVEALAEHERAANGLRRVLTLYDLYDEIHALEPWVGEAIEAAFAALSPAGKEREES